MLSGGMDRAKREELVETYYGAIDAEAFAGFERAFAPDVEYRYPDEPAVHGVEEVRTFFEERRELSNSTHDVRRWVTDGAVTVCEGVVTAEGPDGRPVEVGFVGVFEFDDEAGAISRVGVYTG